LNIEGETGLSTKGLPRKGKKKISKLKSSIPLLADEEEVVGD